MLTRIHADVGRPEPASAGGREGGRRGRAGRAQRGGPEAAVGCCGGVDSKLLTIRITSSSSHVLQSPLRLFPLPSLAVLHLSYMYMTFTSPSHILPHLLLPPSSSTADLRQRDLGLRRSEWLRLEGDGPRAVDHEALERARAVNVVGSVEYRRARANAVGLGAWGSKCHLPASGVDTL